METLEEKLQREFVVVDPAEVESIPVLGNPEVRG